MHADKEIAGLKDERRGPAQHEREVRIGLQVLPMSDDDWDAMQHRHAIAKQNIEGIDDQLRQREEQRLHDLQRAKDKYAQRQLNICSLHNTEWTRFVEQLGQSIGVSSAQHRYISACLTMIQTSRERPILISPTPSPEPGLRLPRTREPDSSHSGGLTTLPTYRDYDRPSNMNSRHIVNGAGTGHRAGPSAAQCVGMDRVLTVLYGLGLLTQRTDMDLALNRRGPIATPGLLRQWVIQT
jgi:hypothetical protein